MDRNQKQEFVTELHERFGESTTVVVAHYKGLTVAEMEDLRKKVRDVGATFRVTKNRLTRLALEGTQFQAIGDLFTGPTGICMSEDAVAAAKVMAEFAKKNDKLVLLGGGYGETVLDVDGVKSLASMPSIEELRAKIVGIIQTPATRIAGVTQAPAGQLARVFNAYATKGEAA